VWLLLNLGFLAWSVWLLSLLTRFHVTEIWLIAFLGFGALRQNFLLGQYYVLLLAILTTAVYCLLRRRDRWAGVALACAFLLKLYAAPFFIFLVIRRQYRAMIAAVLIALVSGISAVTVFGWHGLTLYLTEVLPRSLTGETLNPFHPSNSTFASLLRRLFVLEPELNPHPFVDAPSVVVFLQCAITLTILAVPSLFALANRNQMTKRVLAWWCIGVLLVSPNTASYTFVLLLLPVVLLLDEPGWKNRLYVLLPYVILCLPLNAAVSVVSPRAWLLLLLFVVAGRQQLLYFDRRTGQLAAVGTVLVSTLAAIVAARFPERPSAFARPLAPQPNAIYSSTPIVSNGAVFYESILRDRYVIERWQDGRFEPFIADGHTFHPSLPDAGTKLYFELVAAGQSSIAFFDLPGHQFGVLPVGRQDPHDPAISHDGRILAFLAGDEVCVFDGRSSRKVSAVTSARDISFAPGDGALVLAVNERLHWKINRLDVQTGETTALLESDAELARPSISPDGRMLLYVSQQAGSWQIHVLDVANNHDVQLTAGRCNSFAPAWMRDSREIVFATDCGRGLYLPRLDRMPINGPSDSLAAMASTQK